MEGQSAYQVSGLLQKARKLIEELPRGDRQLQLLERLQEAEQEFRVRDGFFGFQIRWRNGCSTMTLMKTRMTITFDG